MRDLAIRLENRPGALAEMGEALGSAGVSVEGGGAFLFDGRAIAHFGFELSVRCGACRTPDGPGRHANLTADLKLVA